MIIKLCQFDAWCIIKYQNNAQVGENEIVLAVIEFSKNVDKVPWNSFYLSFVCVP